MHMPLEEVNRLAHLARIGLSEQEAKDYGLSLGSILGYVQRLAEIDTTNIPENETLGLHPALRPDAVTERSAKVREAIVQNFPARAQDALSVPAVFEKPKG